MLLSFQTNILQLSQMPMFSVQLTCVRNLSAIIHLWVQRRASKISQIVQKAVNLFKKGKQVCHHFFGKGMSCFFNYLYAFRNY